MDGATSPSFEKVEMAPPRIRPAESPVTAADGVVEPARAHTQDRPYMSR